jgi:UDP-N-acetylglucosamine 2-epimerase (non-hydrolysing)
MAGAIASSKLHLPVGHVEAGLRSFDKTMPEEINRMIADAVSNLFFVPTEESAINLIFEGINPHNIHIMGNTIVDACVRNLKIAEKNSELVSKFDLGENIITLTLHRAENVDDPIRLKNIIDALLELDEFTVVFPVHPRTRKNLMKFGFWDSLVKAEHIQLIKPVGYLDFLILLSHSKLVLTDSGGLQEEAITLNLPCITLRYNTERPETVTAGGNILVGSSKKAIIDNVRRIFNDDDLYLLMSNAPNPYGNGDTSELIVDIILKSYNSGKLAIKTLNEFISHDGWYLQKIDENINVVEYETNNNNSIVRIVFDENKVKYPYPYLSLMGKTVIIDRFNSKLS